MTKQTNATDPYTSADPLLLSLIDWAEKKDLDLPSDLSEKHDDYLWKTAAQKN